MKTLKLGLCFLIFLCLTACSDGELKNFTSFIDSYTEVADYSLSVEDFFFLDGSETTLRAFIDDDECQVMLSLNRAENGKIESLKLTLPKADSTLPRNKAREIFCRILTHIMMAYCSYDENTADEVINAFGLNEPETLYKQGELTLKRDNFYFIYYSNEVTSDVMIYNTYLHTVEATEKPVSKPYYGEDFIEKD